MKVSDVVRHILSLGQGCLLAKIDIDSAFRNVPVNPHDRHLLGMLWKGRLYVDTVLPFGLRSAPKIFNALTQALQWIAVHRGVSYLDHFLDDFVTAGSKGTNECQDNLTQLVTTCAILNLPIALHKREGSTTCLTFLGIELDTEALDLRLPAEKLARLKLTISKWATAKFCRWKEFESLIGLLHDASIVVRPGRTFLRRLIELLKGSHRRRNNAFIRLNKEARSDILWWHRFISQWNAFSMMHDECKAHPDIVLTSDASGSWECGAFWDAHWFQFQWIAPIDGMHITIKEMLPIVFAAAVWGHQLQNKSILCRCDNEAAVHIFNSGTSKAPEASALLRCLHFIAARYNLIVSAAHLPGSQNLLADALSRNNLTLFFDNHPQANPHPTHIPASLIDLLVLTKPDWTCATWNGMFSNINFSVRPRQEHSVILSVRPPQIHKLLPTSRHSTLPCVRSHTLSVRHFLRSSTA